jgi:hypothetical protein
LPSIKFLTLPATKTTARLYLRAGARECSRAEPIGKTVTRPSQETNMTDEHHADRRSFLRTGAIAGTALVAGASGAIAQQVANTATSNAPLTKGDIGYPDFFGRG